MTKFIFGLLGFVAAIGCSIEATRAITPDKAEFKKLADGGTPMSANATMPTPWWS